MSDTRPTRLRPDRPESALDDRGGSRMIGATPPDSGPPGARTATTPRRPGDTIFRTLTTGAGLAIVIAIALIGIFLLIKAVPSLLADKDNFLASANFLTTDS